MPSVRWLPTRGQQAPALPVAQRVPGDRPFPAARRARPQALGADRRHLQNRAVDADDPAQLVRAARIRAREQPPSEPMLPFTLRKRREESYSRLRRVRQRRQRGRTAVSFQALAVSITLSDILVISWNRCFHES